MKRRGFTLVEMLVVIVIILVLAAMTVAAFDFTLATTRTQMAANTVHGMLNGAAMRTVHEWNTSGTIADPGDRPVEHGVGFQAAPVQDVHGDFTIVDSLVHVEYPPSFGTHPRGHQTLIPLPGGGVKTQYSPSPFVVLQREDRDDDWVVDNPGSEGDRVHYVRLTREANPLDPNFWELYQKGLIVHGVTQITVYATKEEWKRQDGRGFTDTVYVTYPDGTMCLREDRQVLRLANGFRPPDSWQRTDVNSVNGVSSGYNWFRIRLPAVPSPNESAELLPAGVAIDLRHSKIPPGWRSAYARGDKRFDLMFNGSGAVDEEPAALGVLHFVVRPRECVEYAVPLDAPIWSDSATYTQGDWVKLDPPNGCLYRAETSGGGGPAASEWPKQTGETVDAGGVTWMAFELGTQRIVTVRTLTGEVTTYPVYESPTGQPDPFRYAELGQ